MRSHCTGIKYISEHLSQTDLSMLALRVVTVRVMVVTARVPVTLSGSFASQIETGCLIQKIHKLTAKF